MFQQHFNNNTTLSLLYYCIDFYEYLSSLFPLGWKFKEASVLRNGLQKPDPTFFRSRLFHRKSRKKIRTKIRRDLIFSVYLFLLMMSVVHPFKNRNLPIFCPPAEFFRHFSFHYLLYCSLSFSLSLSHALSLFLLSWIFSPDAELLAAFRLMRCIRLLSYNNLSRTKCNVGHYLAKEKNVLNTKHT